MAKKILVVDDEMHLARILQFTLENAGYEVFLAYDGREALNRVNEVMPDLVILDLVLPLIDGYKVCNTIKNNEATNGIPVIILTARDLDSLHFDEEVLADRLMQKPFNTDILLKEIEELIRNGKSSG